MKKINIVQIFSTNYKLQKEALVKSLFLGSCMGVVWELYGSYGRGVVLFTHIGIRSFCVTIAPRYVGAEVVTYSFIVSLISLSLTISTLYK